MGLEAYGLLAVGLIAGGIFPTGLLAFGVWSVGLIAYGVMSTGLLAIALIRSVGLVSLGHHSVGLVHFGIDVSVFLLLGLPIAAIWLLRAIGSAIKRAWPSAAHPAASGAPPPDRFWRRFAIVMACVISIPIVISILGLLAAIAIPNFVRARQQSQQNAARQWTQEGWQLWQAQKMDQAAAKFQQAVQLTPDNADAWNGLGWAEFNSGKSTEAEQAFLKAIALDTNQPGALNGLGQIYLSQRKYDQAETYLLRAAPQAPAAWYGLTRLYLLEGKFDQAENWAQKIVDSGQADDVLRRMLNAAKEKFLDAGLRLMIEPRTTNAPPASAETWSPMLAPGEKPDVDKIRQEAQELTEKGQYEEALQRHIWYHNHALQYGTGQTGVRLSFALADWVELSRRYPKAKQALIEIRDHDTKEFAEGRGYFDLFMDVHSLNQYLGQDEATYALFKRIRQSDPPLARQCFGVIEDLLVDRGEYDLCLGYLSDPQAVFESIRQSREQLKTMEAQWAARRQEQASRFEEMTKTNSLLPNPPVSFPPGPPQLADKNFVGQTRQLIEILVGANRKTDAEKIRDEALVVLNVTELQSAVSDAETQVQKVKSASGSAVGHPTSHFATRLTQIIKPSSTSTNVIVPPPILKPDEEPDLIDPATGLPVGPHGATSIDPATGLPIGPGGTSVIDPVTGLPSTNTGTRSSTPNR